MEQGTDVHVMLTRHTRSATITKPWFPTSPSPPVGSHNSMSSGRVWYLVLRICFCFRGVCSSSILGAILHRLELYRLCIAGEEEPCRVHDRRSEGSKPLTVFVEGKFFCARCYIFRTGSPRKRFLGHSPCRRKRYVRASNFYLKHA